MDGGIEEGDECMFWLDVLIRADITRDPKAEELRGEANELVSILVASRSTAVARVQRNKQAKRRAKNRN
jgi:hypothetical protein